MVVLAIVPDESVQLLVAVTARGLVPLLLTTTLGGKHVGAPAGGTTVMLNPWLAANPLESVACTVKLKDSRRHRRSRERSRGTQSYPRSRG